MSNGAAIDRADDARRRSPPVRDVLIPEGPGRARGRAARRRRGRPGDYLAASGAAPSLQPAQLRRAARHAEPRGLPVPGDLPPQAPATVRTLVREQLHAFKRAIATVSHAPRAGEEPDASTTC